jgi:serine/threonine protein kinase
MDRLVGTVLNNTYRVDKLLGQGGMGAVFRAHDVALDRSVAIKLMHSHISVQPGFRARFLQEARAIAALEHPGIVPIYTFSSDPQQLYIVMAFIEGQNLADWLHLLGQRQQAISLPEAMGIVEQVADALAYAHRRGVYHRDIKPGNIILRPLESGQVSPVGLTFQPIVTDFGLAKLAEGGVQSMAGLSMGTPAYMAPEQCEAAPLDGRADIYALGIVLYEMVTGRVPFHVSTLTEALQAHTKEPPPPPRTLAPDLPSPVERIILKALAKRPEERYQTANEMAEALRLVRANTPQGQLAGTTAPTQAGYASLGTMMAQETPPPTPKDSAWPTPPSDIESGAQVLVLGPDGSSTAVAFGARRALTIGRDSGNNIPLNDTQISRQHCQVSTDNGRFFVTDLNSTNGTFLGDNKLLPGVAEPWRPGQAVRVGGHWLRLRIAEGGARQAPPPEMSFAAPMAPRTPTSPLALTLEPDRITVEPGKPATLTLRVLNQQQQVDHFSALVESLPPDWVALPTQPLRLAPGDTGTLALRLTPPRDPTSLSGDHVFDVRVISRADPTVSAHATATLNILPFRAVNMELQPSTFVNAGEGRLTVANLGNSPEAIGLALADPGGVLDTPATGRQVTLQAGQRQQIALPIKARGKRPLMGNPSTSAFQVLARAGDQQLAAAQGSFTVKPILPTWAIPIITTAVLLLCAGAAFAYSNMRQSQNAQQTALAMGVSQATMTAEAILAANATQTAQALAAVQTATAQAEATAEIKAATFAALTATADWLAADSDGDGLTNAQELAYGTDPYNMDTDGDTLPDGYEVSIGTSPINKDTDGDGLQDNVDPNPGELPTHTPEPTAEPTATLLPSPEPTPAHAFAAGAERTLAVSGFDVGEINQVCIRHDNAGPEPDWYVETVRVDGGSGFETFAFNRWLATDKADGNLEACKSENVAVATFSIELMQPLLLLLSTPTVTPTPGILKFELIQPRIVVPKLTLVLLFRNYTVEVTTGAIEGAGTSANVYVKIAGNKGETDWLLLQ